ncbi:hypothetical protein RIF29_23987 [Crotalaria pallida]|uniref:Uncharacterized protein n=1 Tax=Crotalaria pallida TaxID=3830 RepID=A0AAN9HY18_CROPI
MHEMSKRQLHKLIWLWGEVLDGEGRLGLREMATVEVVVGWARGVGGQRHIEEKRVMWVWRRRDSWVDSILVRGGGVLLVQFGRGGRWRVAGWEEKEKRVMREGWFGWNMVTGVWLWACGGGGKAVMGG